MARAKRKTNSQPKPAVTARATRARSKEVAAAAPPPPIAPSRRSTRATSNEPLLGVDQLDKLSKRKARKTPEVQQPQPLVAAPAPPTPVVEEDEEESKKDDVQMMTVEVSSPSPAEAVVKLQASILVSSSPPPSTSVEDMDHDISVEASSPSRGVIEIKDDDEEEEEDDDEENEDDDTQLAPSSPFQDPAPSTEALPSSSPSQLTPKPHQFNHDLSTIAEEASSELATFFSPLPQSKQHIDHEPLSTQQHIVAERQLAYERQLQAEHDHVECRKMLERDMVAMRPLRDVLEYLQNVLELNPPNLDAAKHTVHLLRTLEESRDDDKGDTAQTPPAPMRTPTVRKPHVTPTASVFHQPSDVQKPKSAGLFSKFTSSLSALSSPVTSIASYLTGAKTQPVQKVAPLANVKTPSRPMFAFSRSQASVSQPSRPSPGLEELIHDFIPGETPSKNQLSGKQLAKSTMSQIQTPDRERIVPSPGPTRSVLYDQDGNKIPTEYRNWIGRRRMQQARDMETLNIMEAEVARGLRSFTAEEEKFKSETERKQIWLEMWRARQPANMNKTPQIAGQKRTAGDSDAGAEGDTDSAHPVEAERSAKRVRTEPLRSPLAPLFSSSNRRLAPSMTPIGYSCPVPGDPNYRHVNEEMASIGSPDAESTPAPSRVFGRVSGSTNDAPGSSKPSVRNVGSTFAVPEDDDSMETDDASPVAPAAPRSVGNNFYGLPDDFYDSSSDSDEEEENTLPPAPQPAPAELPGASQSAAQAASANTPFTHKYTPAKPSGLRAVETIVSSPAVITPPASPPDLGEFLAKLYNPEMFDCVPPRSIIDPASLPAVDCTDLENKMFQVYAPLLVNGSV